MTFQGSGAPTSDGDYISSASGLNTFYRFFIEVPPGLPRLVVEIFDPDVGVGGFAEAAQGRDRARTAFNSSVAYTLMRPDGTTAATLHCDSATCLDDAWQTLLDSTTATNTAAGHWELRVDMSSTQTNGDDINAIGIRANDGTSGSGGTELNIYAESPYAFGVNPPASGVSSRSYNIYPYITSGCSCSENDFDYDSNEGNVGSILLMSRTMAFSQTIASAALSGNDAWARNTVTGWTSDDQSGDYGVWQAAIDIKSYVNAAGQNGNFANLYFANFQAAANPPTSNSPPNAFRIYLPTDAGTAAVKPYVEQSVGFFSGPNPPGVGQITRATISIKLVNPTSQSITFSNTNLVTSEVPGAGVVYGGSAGVTQGTVQSQPAVNGTGPVNWNPGTLAAGSTATLKYQVEIIPTAAGQRLPLTGTPASGNGTRAQYVDETGNTTQARATYQFGPLCELAATQGLILPCGTFSSAISGATTICPGDSASLTVTITGGTPPYKISLSNGDTQTAPSPLTFTVMPASTQGYIVSSGFDSTGCPVSASLSTVTVTVRAAIAVTTTNVNPACPGTATGSITVNASGGAPPFMYSDDGGSTFQSASTFSNLASGTYTLVIKDNSNCTKTASATLTDPSPITFTTISVNPSCTGATTGNITVTASGGTGTLVYSDNAGSSFQALNVFSNLAAGPYSLVVKDGSGCLTSPSPVTLKDPAQIVVGPGFIPGGSQGLAYPVTTFTQTNGIGAVTFSETGSLPAGMTFSSGVLSGTPTQTGSFPITITATDQNGCTGSRGYVLAIACSSAGITISPASIPPGSINTPYAGATFTASGGTGPYTLIEAGALPAGITFGNGTLSGTPTQSGVFPISVAATDANGCAGETNYVLVISCSTTTITVSPGTVTAGTAGAAYTPVSFTPSGGTGPYTMLFAGSLPAGMQFSGGTLSGTPTQTGSFNFSVGAADVNGCGGESNYTLNIDCPAITVNPASLPSSAASSLYQATTFTQTGGLGTASFSESGTLPPGLTFNSATATLSGTPSQPGSFPITVTATDSNRCTGSRNYTIVITCEITTVSPSIVPAGTAGSTYGPATFTQTGGIGLTTFSETGTLPTGLTLSTGGVLSGTPTQTGSFPITVTTTDSNGCTGSVNVTVVINCQTITVNPTTIPAGTAGVAYTATTFTQSGGIGTVTLSESGALPTGLSFSAGVLSGTPLQTGSFNITVTATDSNGCTGSRSYTLTINCPVITVNPATLSAGTGGIAYGPVTFTQTGGVGTTTFGETGALPTGLSFSAGVLSGTPTQTGSFNITVTAQDQNGCSGSRDYTLVINCPVITVYPTTIPAGTAGAAYGPAMFTQTGGVGATAFSESGALPVGLTFTAGVLSGTPLQTGSFNVTVTATDHNGCTGSRDYTLVINCPVITVNQTTIPAGTAGSPYPNTAFTQTGGIGAVTFSESGTLPTGITFSAGALSGTPLQTGSFPITITATDQNGCTGSRGYTLVVNCQAIAVSPSSLPAGIAGVAYPAATFSQTGGIGAVTFGESGILPSGMTFSGGILSGTPLQTGTFTITVTATDRNGCTGTQQYSLLINCPSITVNPSAIPAGVAGVPYAGTQFSQVGGVGAIAYSGSGTLPSGISLSSNGLLSGTPLKTGSYPITVTATDRNGCTGGRNYTLVINCPVIGVSPSSLPAAVQYTLYNPVQFTQTGGVGPVTFSTASALPSGMTFSSAGVLSGTPTQAGSFPLTVVAADANGCTGSTTTTLLVTALDKCLKDDTSAKFVQFNSTTGDYLFTVCGANGFSVTGKGTLTVINSVITITDTRPDHRMLIQYNNGMLTGRAIMTHIAAPGVYQSYIVNDTNPNPVCGCGS